MNDIKNWHSDALINIQRFLDKYSTKCTTHLPLVDVMRFRINAILGSEPNQLRWSDADAEELLALIKAYKHILEIEQQNIAQLETSLEAQLGIASLRGA
ncbi:MAG TPA: hypothetical protein DGB85_05870 [Deltaproteobacteria bacterium]|nr:hypothetical protein [Deltaproteobacteria bacterium]